MISAPVFCRRFIGRDSELALLLGRYRDAMAGTGSIVLIGGEAGIGKTRLLREARHRLEREGARLAFGQCLLHSQLPLAPIVDVLRELDAIDPTPLRTIPHIRTALARLFPDLQPAETPLSLNDDRRVQFGAILEALRQFARTTPVLAVIEDTHWADLATLEFLQYAADRVAQMKLVVVITYRTDELHAQHPLTVLLGRISPRGSWTVTLPPLSPFEMRVLADDALEARAPLPARRLDDIVALAEGSPLFAEELLRHAVDAAEATPESSELPLSVRAAVLERITTLDPDDRATLRYAAAIGRRFSAELLSKVRGHDVERIATLLRRVRDLQLIREERKALGTYAFRHALVQEALYGELLWDEARAIHRRIAMELETLEPTEECVMLLAHHWRAAHDQQNAVRYNIAAGDFAGGRLAHDDAIRFYERALEFVDAGSDTQAALYEKLAQALNFAGPNERSRRALQKSLEYYERVGDRRKVVALRLAYACTQCAGDPQGVETSASQALDEISQTAPEDPLYFAALMEFVCLHSIRGDPDAARPFIERAEAFTGTPAPRPLSRFYNFRAIWQLMEGHTQRMVADYEGAAQIASDATDRFSLFLARNNLGYCAMNAGELDVAEAAYEDAIRVARELFSGDHEGYALSGNAELALLRGDLAEARRLVLDSKAACSSGSAGLRLQQASVAIPLGIRLSDAELVDRFASEDFVDLAFGTKQAQRIGPICRAFAELYAHRGQADRARELLRRGASEIGSIATSGAFAIAIAEQGLAAETPRIRTLLERWAAPPESRAGRAFLALFDAFVARTDGRDPRVLAHDAMRRFGELGIRFYEALAAELAGRAHEAHALYRAMGNVRDERRLAADLVPVNRRGRLKNELTAREREIARLIGEGKSNRAIADTLVLSERTVETHVAAILSKYDAHSRAEVAARVGRDADILRTR